MKFLGESFNLMTLGGMAAAVGLIIDDAIVVLENIVLHREAGEGRFEAVALTLHELSLPLVGSTLTPIVVFVPLIAITGVTGVFFRALAVTDRRGPADLAHPGAHLDAHAVPLPAAQDQTRGDGGRKRADASTALRCRRTTPAREVRRSSEMRRLLAGRRTALDEGLLRPRDPLLRALVPAQPEISRSACRSSPSLLIVVSYLCYRQIGSDLLPKMDEGSFILDYVTPPGSSLEETNRMVDHIVQIVRSVPEVESTSRRTGLQLGLAAVTEANTGDISVNLKTDRSRDVWSIMNEMRAKVDRAGACRGRRFHAEAAGHDRRPDQRAAADRHHDVQPRRESARYLGAARRRRHRQHSRGRQASGGGYRQRHRFDDQRTGRLFPGEHGRGRRTPASRRRTWPTRPRPCSTA